MTESLKTASCASCGGGASCQCGGSGCGKGIGECRGGPLQRPQFFAGQLLTEDDLQLLSDYVAAKSRLHNRFLHGDGVVCGLLVMCHPCGGGKVVVQAGTALDCCGNHIVVPCPVELDINAMVRTLRIEKRGGYDCGDPCEEDCEEPKRDANGNVARIDARCIERKGRKYCLYLKYCEVPEEPVAPYVTNGDCAVQVCKPTRIREGYDFELRCPEKEPPPDDVWTRIRCCIGDLTRADKAAQDAAAADLHYSRMKTVLPMVELGRVPELQAADVEQLRTGVPVLQSLLQAAPRNNVARDEALKPAQPDVRALLDTYQATAAAVIRFDLQPSRPVNKLVQANEDLVKTAQGLIQNTGDPLRKLVSERNLPARERLVAEEWISQGIRWTAPDLAAEQRSNPERLSYALNAPHSVQLQRQFSRDLRDLRDWLLDRLESKPLFSDCRLRRDVLAIAIPTDTLSRRDSEAVRQLVQALIRYLLDCICTALNPPCQPCEDSAVKLACLTVDDCEVVSICNLERTFVLSGPNLRYWVPFLHGIGELFERICCEPIVFRQPDEGGDANERKPAALVFDRRQNFMSQTAPTYRYGEAEPQLAALFRLARIDEKALSSVVNLGGNLASLATRDEGFTGMAFSLTGHDIGARVQDAVTTVFETPQVRDALASRVDAHLAEANRASAKTIRELRGMVQNQEAVNEELRARLGTLERRKP